MVDQTTVTLLTPTGRGALASLAVEGPQAAGLVGRRFQPRSIQPLETCPLNRIVFGTWNHRTGQSEEVVVCRTSAHVVEVHCHGGPAAADSILNALIELGAIRIDSKSWIHAHCADGIQAAAYLALGQASTERAAAVLLDQFHGALRRELEEIVRLIQQNDSDGAGRRLTRLAELAQFGQQLTRAWRVTFAGPPNVGKSSLLNAMLGFERAIVLDQPGTTRDLIAAQTAIDGWAVELTGTAGLRQSNDTIETEGLRRTREAMSQADLLVLVFDASQPLLPVHLEQLADEPQALVVLNKADLCSGRPARTWLAVKQDYLLTSALDGRGIEQLLDAVVRRLVPRVPRRGEAVPFTASQCQTLQNALSAHASGRSGAVVDLLADLLGT